MLFDISKTLDNMSYTWPQHFIEMLRRGVILPHNISISQAETSGKPLWTSVGESWVERNNTRINKNKCRVLLLGRNNHVHQYWLEADLASSAKKDMSILARNRLTVSE